MSVEKETEDSGLMTTLARLQAPVFQETKVKCLASLWVSYFNSRWVKPEFDDNFGKAAGP